MANIVELRIIADVPFHFLDRKREGDDTGLSDEDGAFLARMLLSPSMGLEYSYSHLPDIPNDHGGRTAMYRLDIEGQEALRWATMRAFAMALKGCSPLAKLHVAEACDIEDGEGVWALIVDRAELSGEAE